MSYEIFTISGAPRPWRVMLGFVAKGLDFELHVLDASKNEHKAPAFLALNPRGRVPVLRHGDFVLRESLAILSYLEQKHPRPALFGATPEEHARIWQLIGESEHDLRPRISALLRPIFSPQPSDDWALTQKAAVDAHAELKRLEQLLSESPLLVSDRVTAADCVCFPEVRLVRRAIEREPERMRQLEFHPFERTYPRLAAWMSEIEQLPHYAKTFPTHWRAA